MKFHVAFTEGTPDDPFKWGVVGEPLVTVEAAGILDAAEKAHSAMGLGDDTDGIMVVVAVEACSVVVVGTKAAPDFHIHTTSKGRKKTAEKPKV